MTGNGRGASCKICFLVCPNISIVQSNYFHWTKNYFHCTKKYSGSQIDISIAQTFLTHNYWYMALTFFVMTAQNWIYLFDLYTPNISIAQIFPTPKHIYRAQIVVACLWYLVVDISPYFLTDFSWGFFVSPVQVFIQYFFLSKPTEKIYFC